MRVPFDLLELKGRVEGADEALGVVLGLPAEHIADGLGAICPSVPPPPAPSRRPRPKASPWRGRIADFLGEKTEGGKVVDRLARAPGGGAMFPVLVAIFPNALPTS